MQAAARGCVARGEEGRPRGDAQSDMFLPNTPPLVGVVFYHQLVPIELDAQGAWVSVTATNAIQLTAGL